MADAAPGNCALPDCFHKNTQAASEYRGEKKEVLPI